MGKQPYLYSFRDGDALADALREYILDCQTGAFSRHGTFRIAVSGGSLPKVLSKALLTEGDNGDAGIDFTRWVIFFADERAVPLDHEDSNYKLIKEELLDKIPVGQNKPKIQTIAVEHLGDTQELADQYQNTLKEYFARKDSVKLPIFDLMLLGCGPDGHTCSLFPNHHLLKETDAWVAPIDDSPKPPKSRITLTLPVVTASTKIAFVATGDGKKEVLRKIFDSEDGRSLPCGIVNEQGAEKVSWFTDGAAVEGVAFPQRGSL